MSIYVIVTEEDLINLGKLREQQENQQANKVKKELVNKLLMKN